MQKARSGNKARLDEHDRLIVANSFVYPGALFSVVASAEVLAAAVAMIVYPYVYPLTLKDVLKSGTLYILLAILCIIPASLLL